jgi:hypothetical protein
MVKYFNMNKNTVDALCFLLKCTHDDLLRSDCFNQRLGVAADPLQLFTGLSLGQHYVNSYLASIGKEFEECGLSYLELMNAINRCQICGCQIAINLFTDEPFIIVSQGLGVCNIVWSSSATHPVSTAISSQNSNSYLKAPFDSLIVVPFGKPSNDEAKKDKDCNANFRNSYVISLTNLFFDSNKDPSTIGSNLLQFADDADHIACVTGNAKLSRASSELRTLLSRPGFWDNPISDFQNLKTILETCFDLLNI